MEDKKQIEEMYLLIEKNEKELIDSFENIIIKRDKILISSDKNRLLYKEIKKSENLEIFDKNLKNNHDRIVKLSKEFCESHDEIIQLHESISSMIFEILLNNNIDENIINKKMKLLNHRILKYKKIQKDTKIIFKNIEDEINE